MDADVAADVAIHLDRLALCVHRPASRRPDLRAELGGLELPPQSIVVVAARFLAAGRVSLADVQSLSPYETTDDLRALLDAHVRRGLITPIDGERDAFVPTDAIARAASAVLTVQAEEAQRLWTGSTDLASVRQQAEAHVAAALTSPLSLDAFRRQVGVHHALPDSDSGQLLGSVTELRYLRADVHAACLGEAGLAGPSARALHRLWRGFSSSDPIDQSLIERRLVEMTPDGPIATELGVATCERVEAATNIAFATVLSGVEIGGAVELLAALLRLPGEDPRPTSDR